MAQSTVKNRRKIMKVLVVIDMQNEEVKELIDNEVKERLENEMIEDENSF